MNSEELEQSLREEFENHLGTVLAQVKQDVAEFQSRIESEFEKHRTQVDEAFKGFTQSFDTKTELHAGFRESVSEHLKLARDEGARLAATAYTEAEKMDEASAPAAPSGPGISELRDAIDEISSQDSQSSILKSLVDHGAQFAPRGAFFIVKNEHFAGWRVFGDDDSNDAAVRDIHFPTSADSILGKAAESRSTVEAGGGEYSGDDAFLSPLNFGQPDRMIAIPLIARGKAVAALYADSGDGQGLIGRDALETLVKIAGLTVELRATPQPAADTEVASETQSQVEDSAPSDGEFAFSENIPNEGGFPPAVVEEYEVETASEPAPEFEDTGVEEHSFTQEPEHEHKEEPAFAQTPEPEPEPAAEPEYETAGGAMVFDSGGSIESAAQPIERSPFERSVEPFEPAGAIGGMSRSIEPAVAEVAPPSIPHARLSDRPVDLPIEVPEDERRPHNDARRFARLLVSEIKLYNEKKVLEGRQAHDLYDRLKEAIDRSREMYDKRVQPPVAARFDYFHYELVNALGEGDAARLGENYPGATV